MHSGLEAQKTERACQAAEISAPGPHAPQGCLKLLSAAPHCQGPDTFITGAQSDPERDAETQRGGGIVEPPPPPNPPLP